MVAVHHDPAHLPALPQRPFVYYPESDGKPMAESDAHYRNITDVRYALERHFAERGQTAYVGANLFLYYQEGEPTQVVAPDVFVVLGLAPGARTTYKVWEEGRMPDVIFEFTSLSTRLEDLGVKRGLYEVLGVREYILFDPWREHLERPLRQYRRAGAELVPVVESPACSTVLGLELHVVEQALRLKRPGANTFLLTPFEEAARADAEAQRARSATKRAKQEAQRAKQEAAARRELEAQLTRLRAELEELRGR